MKKSIIIILVSLPLLLSSCASSRFFSQQRASDLSQIALVEPFAYITDAIGDWSTKYLDDASKANQMLVAEIVTSMGLPIEKTVPMEHHTKASAQTDEWLRRLSDLGAGTARNLVIPDDIRDAVSRSGCRYGLLISDLGFIKNPDIYAFEQVFDTSRKVIRPQVQQNRNRLGSKGLSQRCLWPDIRQHDGESGLVWITAPQVRQESPRPWHHVGAVAGALQGFPVGSLWELDTFSESTSFG